MVFFREGYDMTEVKADFGSRSCRIISMQCVLVWILKAWYKIVLHDSAVLRVSSYDIAWSDSLGSVLLL